MTCLDRTTSPPSARNRGSAITLALCMLPLALSQQALASERTYSFTGLATVGAFDGGPAVQPFTGVFIYNDDFMGSTEYLDNSVVQGFKTTYAGAVTYLGITLANGEKVEAHGGYLQVNNIQQAEIGSPWPADLSMQAWTAGASGTINGLPISNLYLAFLPVAPDFSWDALDSALGGNAEQLLGENPALLPPSIDPLLTGTALPNHLSETFANGLFLGTNHAFTNTVNPVYTFFETTAPVPEPGTWALMLAGGAAMGVFARRRRATPGF